MSDKTSIASQVSPDATETDKLPAVSGMGVAVEVLSTSQTTQDGSHYIDGVRQPNGSPFISVTKQSCYGVSLDKNGISEEIKFDRPIMAGDIVNVQIDPQDLSKALVIPPKDDVMDALAYLTDPMFPIYMEHGCREFALIPAEFIPAIKRALTHAPASVKVDDPFRWMAMFPDGSGNVFAEKSWAENYASKAHTKCEVFPIYRATTPATSTDDGWVSEIDNDYLDKLVNRLMDSGALEYANIGTVKDVVNWLAFIGVIKTKPPTQGE